MSDLISDYEKTYGGLPTAEHLIRFAEDRGVELTLEQAKEKIRNGLPVNLESETVSNAPELQSKSGEDEGLSTTLVISTLTNQFEVSLLGTHTIRDLHLILAAEPYKLSDHVMISTEDGKTLRDDEFIASLPTHNLVCVTSVIAPLERRLGDLQSPGCEFQKYLRTYQGVPAGDERILRTFWALASLAGCKHPSGNEGDSSVDQVGGAVVMLLNAIWNGESSSDQAGDLELVRNAQMTADVEKVLTKCAIRTLERSISVHYSIEAHEQVLSWVLRMPSGEACESGSVSPRFRVVMAEIDQILCRGAGSLLEGSGNSRQIEAYQELLKAAACSSEPLAHMASFGRS